MEEKQKLFVLNCIEAADVVINYLRRSTNYEFITGTTDTGFACYTRGLNGIQRFNLTNNVSGYLELMALANDATVEIKIFEKN